ncbi:MAG: glycosyltransferase family 39 protein [Flavobacteriales bacterium]|nr:glycosyltransferase family 39 protein [Flavobacteriales bacterium]
MNYSYEDVLTFHGYKNLDAGHHLLSALLSRLMGDVFGYDPWSLRLPSMLAHLCYIFGTYKLCKQLFKHKFLLFATFLGLNFNPYLLDFFALFRGYALAIAAMVWSLFFLFKFFEDWKIRNLILSNNIAAVSVLCNLALLNYFLAIIAIQAIFCLNKIQKKDSIRLLLSTSMAFGLVALVLAKPVMLMRENGSFYFGGETGFIHDTLTSLYRKLFYEMYYMEHLKVLFQTLLCIGIVFILFKTIKSAWQRTHPELILVVIFVFIFIGLEVQNLLLDTKFLIERTALFLFPILFLIVMLAFKSLKGISRSMLNGSAFLLGATFLLHFGCTYNNSYVLDWRHEAQNKKVISEIYNQFPGTHEGWSVQIGVSSFYTPSMNYYRELDAAHWLMPFDRVTLTSTNSMWYINPDQDDVQMYLDKGTVLIDDSIISGSYLIWNNDVNINEH